MKGKKTGGRRRGTPNKVTGELRQMVLQALADAGGVAYLTARAKDTPTAFIALLGKVLPIQAQLSGEDGKGGITLTVTHELHPLKDGE